MRFEFNDDSQKICNSADVVNYGIQCDICGNKFQSVSNINGRRYCVGCYYKTFIKDNQQTEITQLKQQLVEKDKKLLEFKRDRLYFELLLTRLQWLHKKADDYRQEKERFGIADMSLSSVWDVLELKKNDLCEYEEMCALQEGIECVANSKLLGDIEHDLQVKTTRSEDEIFKDIDKIDQQIKELKGEKDVKDKNE